jgi:cupin 2 domain-containing protein
VNVFELPAELPADEVAERLAGSREVLVERIISTGQATPPGEWLVQERDEWVVLLQGEAALSYDDSSRVELRMGDHVLIPAGRRHRVERTSEVPPCIWLAVHALELGSE